MIFNKHTPDCSCGKKPEDTPGALVRRTLGRLLNRRQQGMGDLTPEQWQATCTGTPPLPIECFTAGGATMTQAVTHAQQDAVMNQTLQSDYQIAYHNWELNDGRRWVNGVWTQTSEPPPPPPNLTTDPVYIAQHMIAGTAWAPSTVEMPYYAGGGVTTITGPNQLLAAGTQTVYDFGAQPVNSNYYPTANPAVSAPVTGDRGIYTPQATYSLDQWSQMQTAAAAAAVTTVNNAPQPASMTGPTPAPAPTTQTAPAPTQSAGSNPGQPVTTAAPPPSATPAPPRIASTQQFPATQTTTSTGNAPIVFQLPSGTPQGIQDAAQPALNWLNSLPTWALIAGAGAGAYLLANHNSKNRR